jgi:D-beta-D-heptose 7-phosphate kinase/D-beta-D-heptose 1-phosphate adenosyltransferase
MDLAALHARVIACGVVGGDAQGPALCEALAKEGVEASGLIVDSSRPTTLKQNLIGLAQSRHPQKMFRVDVESREPISESVATRLTELIAQRMPEADVVVIEDYAKGVCSDALCAGVIGQAQKLGKPVFVDPARGAPVSRYRGATTMTPNRPEAELLAGLATERSDDPAKQAQHNARLAQRLLDEGAMEAVVLTLDKHGALLLQRGESSPVLLPTQAREVYDVSGAGDMFIAGLAAARGNGWSWQESVRFANASAGLEVEVFGVQPIPFEHVRDALLRDALSREGGAGEPGKASNRPHAASLARAQALVRDAKRRGKKVVFTNGCFDVLHSGHVTLLEQAAALGDFLVVGLNADESVRRLKGSSRPVNNENDRARVLAALGCVGCVVLFGSTNEAGGDEAAGQEKGEGHSAPDATLDTPVRLIEALKPDVLVKGGDYTRATVVGADIVERHGGVVRIIPLVEGKSTTATIARMRA